MKALDRALLRDLRRLRAQVLTLGLVVACGASVFVALKGTIDTIVRARDDYFRAQRLADVFVTLKRAPRATLADLAAIPGVALVEGRVAGDVPVFLDRGGEPATVHLVSLDPRAPAPLDDVRVRRGRLPSPERDDEVVLGEPFAEATGVAPGGEVSAVLNGRLRRLRVVGIGISPEFVFSFPPGAVSANDARYGVAWMLRTPLEAAFELGGAFNDAVFRLAPGAARGDVVAAVDRRLAAFGGRGAYGRDEQYSTRQLDSRIDRMRAMLAFLPTLFLLVAAFVLNVVLGRLVQTQREQIGTLKAFGYGNRRLAGHYLALAVLAVTPGALVGAAVGVALGDRLIALYVRYFRIPLTGSELDVRAIAGALAVVLGAAALGALQAMRGVARLQPVEAMRAPAPRRYRRTALSRLRLARRLPAAPLMVGRNLRLAPLRAVASIVALAFAAALCVTGSFLGGALDALVEHEFDRARREDLDVGLVRSVATSACSSLRALDGVVACEPLDVTPVRARFGPRSVRVGLTSFAVGAVLRRVVDTAGRIVPIPPAGLLASQRLLDDLGAAVGDAITVETIEGRQRRVTLAVNGAVDDQIGLNLYASQSTATQITLGAPVMSAALLRLQPGREPDVARRLARVPAVIGTTSRAQAMADFEEQTAQTMRVLTGILAILSAALAVAVVYNGARVALAERARDLASLRVLGFTRAEVARILLGEMGLVLGAGVPLGLLLGRTLAALTVRGLGSDDFRLPLVVTPATYLFSAAVVIAAALASALHVRRLIDRLDLVEVLKTRE